MKPFPRNPQVPLPAACGAKSARPEGWKKDPYPRCNRPSGHQGPHREYDRIANVLHEWWEAMDDGGVRR
jgi:hypothetical protein